MSVLVGRKPQPRTNHILALSGNLLLLHGGFGDNFHFEDTWHYSIVENRWIEKTDFVHASYPETCTDDLITIQQDTSCIELGFPSDLKRSNESTLALKYQEILPFNEQMGFTPDPEFPLYFGIVDSASELVKELRQKYLEREVYNEKGERIWLESTVADGTPIAPNAATAPRQYARQKRIKYNETTELEVWEWCVSVSGEPTRDRTDSEKLARSNTSVLIPQPRRQSPGWDGCAAIKWKHPTARADHASVYVEKFDMLVMYGGIGYGPGNGPYAASPTVLGDLWVLNMHNCAHNCSGNGVCTDSFCECDPGYFGVDCSNVTCPGSVCHYDANRNQHCTHCCYDDVDGRKAPCQLTNDELMIFSGRSEGICDGFGTCQCAPPYIGEDCSILDCPYNCSFNGYCIVEFPQSRCMCKDGYTGKLCVRVGRGRKRATQSPKHKTRNSSICLPLPLLQVNFVNILNASTIALIQMEYVTKRQGVAAAEPYIHRITSVSLGENSRDKTAAFCRSLQLLLLRGLAGLFGYCFSASSLDSLSDQKNRARKSKYS